MKILEINNLIKKYGKVLALDNINLDVNKGEVYGFIGPNGAGKTTTIRLILGILKANEGEIKVFEKDAWGEAVSIHEKIAYVPGEVSLWPNLTGGEIIDLFLKLRGEINYEKRDELVKRFNLDTSKKCRTYSKGNRQKVALIAAFASDADLYILDEPTSGLDPLMEKIFQECVREVKKQGKSVFLSSHILSEVEKLCDRVSIIREGKIIETGTLEELRHLTQTSIYLETKKPLDGFEKLDYISNFSEKEKGVSFQVDTDKIGEVVKYIADYEVLKFESAPPNLEELFMRHYENDGGV